MLSFRGHAFGHIATRLSVGACVAVLVLGVGLSGCGGDNNKDGESSGMAGAIDLTKKDEAGAAAPKKSAAGLRGQGLGGDAPARGKR